MEKCLLMFSLGDDYEEEEERKAGERLGEKL